MKKRFTLFKRTILLAVMKYSKLEVVSDDLRKFSMTLIPSGIVGILTSGTVSKITVTDSFALIFNGVIIYLLSLLLDAANKTKGRKFINRMIFSLFILFSEIHIVFLLISLAVKLFL